MSHSNPPEGARTRREPPRFRRVTVARVEQVNPRLVRATFSGPELEGLRVEQPAASVRLLLPTGGADLVFPDWDGNEFLLPGGGRPTIRTFTPRRVDPAHLDLDLEIVVHGSGAASTWADSARPGDAAAISGPARGYTSDPDAPGFLLAGDETAVAALSQLLEVLPATASVQVHVEVAHADARRALPEHLGAAVEWHELPSGAPPGDTLVGAVRDATIPEGARVWAAGEAAAMQRIRRHLFEDRGLPRAYAAVRGYWKHGRAGDGERD